MPSMPRFRPMPPIAWTRVVPALVCLLTLVGFGSAARAQADLDGDGTVGFSDFLLLSRRFNTDDPLADIDGSGSVAFADFLILSTSYDADATPDPTLPAGDLVLIVHEDLTVSMRNPTGEDVSLLGCSLVTAQASFQTSSGAAPFSIQLVDVASQQDLGNLGNPFVLQAGVQVKLDTRLEGSFQDLPADLQFQYGTGDDDTVYVGDVFAQRAGDLNLDGEVGFADAIMLSRRFGQPDPTGLGDVDGDGTVAFTDFLILSTNYEATETIDDLVTNRGLVLVLHETEGAFLRNNSAKELSLLGVSVVSPNAQIDRGSGSDPFAISLLLSSQRQDAINLGNPFVLGSGETVPIGLAFQGGLSELGRLEFRFALAETDEIQRGEVRFPERVATEVVSWGRIKSRY
ncbi:MAG: hypothetical protein HKO53_12465 [Gemmatimonadetes bacterium]|nr:hypothetical protein [Gemmatimonadota bacterium]